jgi:hypothetical protein
MISIALSADELSDDSSRRAFQQFQYHRRSLRATHEPEDLKDYALALSRELPNAIGDDWNARTRPDDIAPGEDPLEGDCPPLVAWPRIRASSGGSSLNLLVQTALCRLISTP